MQYRTGYAFTIPIITLKVHMSKGMYSIIFCLLSFKFIALIKITLILKIGCILLFLPTQCYHTIMNES